MTQLTHLVALQLLICQRGTGESRLHSVNLSVKEKTMAVNVLSVVLQLVTNLCNCKGRFCQLYVSERKCVADQAVVELPKRV